MSVNIIAPKPTIQELGAKASDIFPPCDLLQQAAKMRDTIPITPSVTATFSHEIRSTNTRPHPVYRFSSDLMPSLFRRFGIAARWNVLVPACVG